MGLVHGCGGNLSLINEIENLKKQISDLRTELNGKNKKITSSDVVINAIANKTVDIAGANIIEGTAPSDSYAIPVVVGHFVTNEVIEEVFWDHSSWKIRSSDSQKVRVRFYIIGYQ